MNSDFFISAFQIKLTQLMCEKYYGKKLSKICITDMATANAMGNNLPMFVIGKAKNSGCFKNFKFFLCCYRNQQKSWMDGKLFEKWFRQLDRKFAFEGRNVAFVMDNC